MLQWMYLSRCTGAGDQIPAHLHVCPQCTTQRARAMALFAVVLADPGARFPPADLELCSDWPRAARNLTHDQQHKEQGIWLRGHGDLRRQWNMPASSWPSGATIVDIGSHIGADILSLLRRLNSSGFPPGLKVEGFEPSAQSRAVLQRRLAPWREHVNINPQSVGTLTTRGCFRNAGVNGVQSYVDASAGCSGTTVDMLAVADVLRRFERVDLLNVNCEGCELQVMRGLTAADALPLLSRVRAVEVQYHLALGCAWHRGRYKCGTSGVSPDEYCDLDARLRRAGCRLAWRYVYVWERWECGSEPGR